jgi:NAD(P)H-nitrite reductase large subunit
MEGKSDYFCDCNRVPERVLRELIAREGLRSIAAIGRRTGAGEGCGSCRAGIALLVREILGGEPDYSSADEENPPPLSPPMD